MIKERNVCPTDTLSEQSQRIRLRNSTLTCQKPRECYTCSISVNLPFQLIVDTKKSKISQVPTPEPLQLPRIDRVSKASEPIITERTNSLLNNK